MATFEWVAPEAIVTALTTELNSLANGALSAASGNIDNETDLYQYISLELSLASLTPTGSPISNVYLLATLDGTNFENSSASNAGALLGAFAYATGAGTKRVILKNLVIPPLKFQLVIENKSGPAYASSGNTLKYRRHNEQSV
jgi:hypothetical protein